MSSCGEEEDDDDDVYLIRAMTDDAFSRLDDDARRYQRQQAKMMVKYFKDKQYEEAVEDAQVFGFTPKNEINNGRWTMFGLLVGTCVETSGFSRRARARRD